MRFLAGVGAYAGVVMALVVVSFLTEDTAGPALYITAGALTLPVGFLIYPALWLNFAGLIGVVVVFGLAAVGNAFLARELWSTWRAARSTSHPDRPDATDTAK